MLQNCAMAVQMANRLHTFDFIMQELKPCYTFDFTEQEPKPYYSQEKQLSHGYPVF